MSIKKHTFEVIPFSSHYNLRPSHEWHLSPELVLVDPQHRPGYTVRGTASKLLLKRIIAALYSKNTWHFGEKRFFTDLPGNAFTWFTKNQNGLMNRTEPNDICLILLLWWWISHCNAPPLHVAFIHCK